MRLIDVDPMREEVLHNWQNEPVYCANDVLDLIDQQDTVEQPRWVPVTERLPRRRNANGSIYEICNLWHKGGYATAGRFHWGKMTWTFMPWDGTRVISVPHSKGVITHWQPLPAPPTPEECSAVEVFVKEFNRLAKEDDHGT